MCGTVISEEAVGSASESVPPVGHPAQEGPQERVMWFLHVAERKRKAGC